MEKKTKPDNVIKFPVRDDAKQKLRELDQIIKTLPEGPMQEVMREAWVKAVFYLAMSLS